jgi:hypothetical protein
LQHRKVSDASRRSVKVNASRRILRNLCVSAIAGALVAGPAAARTATYVSPASIDDRSLYQLSNKGDGRGYVVPLSTTLALVFDAKFASVKGADTVTIFTLAPATGDARAAISIGIYNGGLPTILMTKTLNAGGALILSNLFQAGCGVFSGCDFISITTTRARGGASGVEVDYIDVNGEVVEIAAPAPEPEVFALMIVSFGFLAARLKSQRARRAAFAA